MEGIGEIERRKKEESRGKKAMEKNRSDWERGCGEQEQPEIDSIIITYYCIGWQRIMVYRHALIYVKSMQGQEGVGIKFWLRIGLVGLGRDCFYDFHFQSLFPVPAFSMCPCPFPMYWCVSNLLK